MKAKMFGIFVVLFQVFSVHAETLISEDFNVNKIEDLVTRGWTYSMVPTAAGNLSIVNSPSRSGNSLRMTYTGEQCTVAGTCAEERNANISKDITAVEEIYTRQWVYYSAIDSSKPMKFVDEKHASAKQVYFNAGGRDPVSTVFGYHYIEGATNSPIIGIQRNFTVRCPNGRDDVSCGYLPNLMSKNMPINKFVCVETHQKMNTNGQSDGIIEVWIDGEQTTSYKNVLYRNNSTSRFRHIQLFRQFSVNAYRYEDDFAAATTRIGCGAAPPSPKAPATPKNLKIRL